MYVHGTSKNNIYNLNVYISELFSYFSLNFRFFMLDFDWYQAENSMGYTSVDKIL